jgi:hypothetical protein
VIFKNGERVEGVISPHPKAIAAVKAAVEEE